MLSNFFPPPREQHLRATKPFGKSCAHAESDVELQESLLSFTIELFARSMCHQSGVVCL